jgi:transposase-like protein
MAVRIVKSVSESVGARRASALSETEPAESHDKTSVIPDPEVTDKAERRRFSAKYKLSILQQVDACTEPGRIGALLRREGLYSSNLNTWRRQRDEGSLAALRPKPRGRKAAPADPVALENERLRKENARLAKRLKQAELIIDVQKKVSQILGITLAAPPESEID